MSRSFWKPKCFFNSSLKKVWSRNEKISSNLIGKSFLVHNGSSFKNVFITREKVGFSFGEFSFTRRDGKGRDKSNKKLKK